MSALRPPDNGVLAEGPLLDTRSVEYLAERLAAVPGVVAVTSSGGRADKIAHPVPDEALGARAQGGVPVADQPPAPVARTASAVRAPYPSLAPALSVLLLALELRE